MRPEDTKMTEEEKQAIKDSFKSAGEETVLYVLVFFGVGILTFWGWWELFSAIPPH